MFALQLDCLLDMLVIQYHHQSSFNLVIEYVDFHPQTQRRLLYL